MDDDKIIRLYFARSEDAITQTDKKYGGYCRTIAYNILHNDEDSEECVNDTWLNTWNAIPPRWPLSFWAHCFSRQPPAPQRRNMWRKRSAP